MSAPEVLGERCETCRFWKRGERPKAYDDFGAASEELIPAEFGDCRRYAPRGAVVINEAASGMLSGEVWPWAIVNETDWCGEYRAQQEREDHAR